MMVDERQSIAQIALFMGQKVSVKLWQATVLNHEFAFLPGLTAWLERLQRYEEAYCKFTKMTECICGFLQREITDK